MAYSSLQDLIDRFGEQELIELTDRDRLGQIDQAVIARAQADADAEIDGYLGGRVPVPLATVPGAVVRIACNLTRYYLWADRASDEVRRRYEDGVKFLAAVGKGQIDLGLSPAATQAVAEQSVQMETGGRVWDRGNGGFI